MLVDFELAERARALLREPGEANGKGNFMSALGTHDLTAAPGYGLEPPLSPPVVGGPLASAMPIGDGALSGLPTPPPAIRPPERAMPAPAPAPAPVAAPAPQPAEPAVAPAPAPVAPVQPEPEPPSMAPEPAAPTHDYFAAETPAPAPAPEPAPEPEVHSIPLMAPAPAPELAPAPEPVAAPAAPAEEVVELPAMAPLEPLPPMTPAAEVELAPLAPEPVVELVPEPVAEVVLPVVEPVAASAPEPAMPELVVEEVAASVPELDELFAAKRATDFRVVVRLKEGEGVEVGSFRDFGTAMEGAQEVIEQFSNATDGQWPFYAGRFLRPDLIVSVDVVEGGDEL